MKHVDQIIQLGHISGQNATTWSFGKTSASSRQTEKDEFSIHLGYAMRPIGTFAEEAVRVAQNIAENTPGPVTILASGGSDSEVVIKSFLIAKRPFQVVTFDMSSLNGDELSHLDSFCRSHQITYKRHHIDVVKFLENDVVDFARTSGSTSPQINTLLYGLSQIDGHLVLGDGELSIHRIEKKFFEVWQERQSYARWMLATNRPGCPSFFSYSPEIELAMYSDPIVEDFTNVGWHLLDSSHFDYCKPFLYYHHFGTRIREKVQVFKPIQELEHSCHSHLQKILPGADSEVRMSYEKILSKLQKNTSLQEPLRSDKENGRRLVIE